MNRISSLRSPWTRWAGCLVLSAGLAGCGGGGDDEGTVAGRVTHAGTGQPVSDARVSVGDQRTYTGADGRYRLTDVDETERAVVHVEAAGFAEAMRVTAVDDGETSTVDTELLPVAGESLITVATGGTATVAGSPAQVVLAANALVDRAGRAATGQATVRLTPIDPAANVELMPGDFTARTDDGVRPMESFGAMSVDIRDAEGRELQLAEGQTATVRIPVATRAPAPPATVPLFHFDENTGYWVEEGTATLSGDGTYYEGTVSHFSVWNADSLYDAIDVTGCLRNESGEPVEGARVASEGIDYSGTSSVLTDAQGNFTIPIKPNARAILTSTLESRMSNTLTVGPHAAAVTLEDCLVLGSAESNVSVKLTWGQQPEDVDSHLYLPNGAHVYFENEGSLTAAPWANLDVDDVTSYGPEVVTVRRLMVGTYRYLVHNYDGTHTPGMTDSPVRVELNAAGERQVFTPAAGESNTTGWWSAFDFTVDERCNITVTPVQTWSATPPAPAPASEPRYCEAG